MSAFQIKMPLFVLLLSWACPEAADAQEHPLLERARLASDRAEFEQARAMLEELPVELNLSIADLRRALLLRAELSYALRDHQAMERDLARLARFTDSEDLPDNLPPALRERIDGHRNAATPISIDTSPERLERGVRVTVRSPEPDDLVLGSRLFVREENGPWTVQDIEDEVVDIDRHGRLELYAEVIGLGGAVLARAGSREDPVVVQPARRRLRAWPFIVAAVAAGIALGVGLGVGLSQTEDPSIQVGAPIVSW